jgi:hypothetical protein
MQGANVVGTDRALIEGRISDRGRFDLTATRLAEAAGEVSPLRERTLFDGSCFVWDCPESELGLALGPSYPRLSETAELLAGDNRPLFGWIVDPFFLPLFDGVTVQASPPNAQGQVILERAVQVGSMGAFLERWTVDASSQQAHPTHLEWIDSLGRRIFEVDY